MAFGTSSDPLTNECQGALTLVYPTSWWRVMFSRLLWGPIIQPTKTVDPPPEVKVDPHASHIRSSAANACSWCDGEECIDRACNFFYLSMKQCSVTNESTRHLRCESLICPHCTKRDFNKCDACFVDLPVCIEHRDTRPGTQPRCCPPVACGDATRLTRCARCHDYWMDQTGPGGRAPPPAPIPKCSQCWAELCPTCLDLHDASPPVLCAGASCGHKRLAVCSKCRAQPRDNSCEKGHVFCGYACSTRQRCTVCRNWACIVCEDGQFVHKACMRHLPKRAVKKEKTEVVVSRKRKA